MLTPQQLLRRPVRRPRRGSPRPRPAADRRPSGRCCCAAAADGWTPADVPLLDEAAELLGEDDTRPRAAPRRCAPGSGSSTPRARWTSPSGSRLARLRGRGRGRRSCTATDLLDAEPAGRAARATTDQLTTAQRAAADRSWAFGHIIVDEAQELSPMAWRLLMRRCPSRSMTLVGRRGPDRRAGRRRVLGAGALAVRGRPLAAGGADRQLPHPGRDHGASPAGCWPRSTRRSCRRRSVRETGVPPWARAGATPSWPGWPPRSHGSRPSSATAGWA